MKCALFDLDGTVADTEILKAKAIALTIQKLGGEATPETYKSVMGQGWNDVTGAFFQKAGLEANLDVFNPIFREFYGDLVDSELDENRSIKSFLKFLKEKEFSLGLVSSASPWMIQKALTKLNLVDAFDTIISNADTEKHKPHPEAYLKALAKLQRQPSNTIAFEDSESGFKAATAAGLPVYGVKHAYNEIHRFDLCRGTITSFDECLSWEIFRE
jgi:HAD superfamily hydrolase (TIGR01509 family)